ncbi:LysR family transcriptional regulator [Dongia sp. agr-C8]
MDSLTLDQFAVFATVVAEGSFAAAARRMNRAQSAITYAIQKLEEQSGVQLFDRSAYRPELTEAGRALLPRARRILDDVDDFRLQAAGVTQGVEAELSLVVDAFAPDFLGCILKEFREAFPLVTLRITVELFQATRNALLEGTVDLALMASSTPMPAEIERRQCAQIELIAVAAADHPLAKIKGPFAPELLRDHLQLVLTSRSEVLDRRDYGVHAVRHWRIADMNLRHKLLLAGVGWCSMPRALVAADLAAGRLVELKPLRWEGSDRMPRFPLVIAHRRDKALGPAAKWLVQRLAAGAAKTPQSRRKPVRAPASGGRRSRG